METRNLYFTRELECSGKIFKVKQLYIGDVGCVVWDAAIVLSKFLENEHYYPAGFWTTKNTVDIGSGTGVVGIAAGVLGACVTVTDLPEFVPLMAGNIDLNQDVITGSVAAKPLKWGDNVSSFLPSPDVVLLADVIYYEESLQSLIKTLVDLCDCNTKIIMSYEERTTGNKMEIEQNFFQIMATHFTCTEVPFSKLNKTFRSHDIHVILFCKNHASSLV